PRRKVTGRDRAVRRRGDRRRVVRTARRPDARSSLTDLAWPVILLIGLVVVLGAYVQAVVGLGLGLLAAPVIAVVARALVPVLTRWVALLISRLNLADERRHVDWRSTAWSLPARVPGTVVGAWLVAAFTEEQIGLVLAVMVLVAVAL